MDTFGGDVVTEEVAIWGMEEGGNIGSLFFVL